MSRTYEEIPAIFYRTPDPDDYLIVVGVVKEGGRIVAHTGAASAIAGNPHQIIGAELSGDYLKCCQRVASDQVPAQWLAALNRYRNRDRDLSDGPMPQRQDKSYEERRETVLMEAFKTTDSTRLSAIAGEWADDPIVLSEVAGNPQTPPDVLQRLARYKRETFDAQDWHRFTESGVRKDALANASTPLGVVREAAHHDPSDEVRAAAQHALAQRAMAKSPHPFATKTQHSDRDR